MDISSDYNRYKCPRCGSFLQTMIFTSFNNLGGTFWSDGSSSAMMSPRVPNLTKCKKCNAVFFLHNCEHTKESIYGKKHKDDQDPEFLNLDELIKVLKEKAAKTKYEKLIIRHELWRAFNSRIRHTMYMEDIQHLNAKKIAALEQEMCKDKKEKDIYEKNCKALIKLLDPKDVDDIYTIADLYRTLGEFEKCMEIIDGLKTMVYAGDYYYKKIKYNYRRECKRRNPLVFELYTADRLKEYKVESREG